ncbi:MAG: hypothetical protein K6E78_07475 [Treponema sp.]|nr:hypothetical protein [Treponema sp.]
MVAENTGFDGLKTIRAKNLAEARKILFGMYNYNYKICSQRSVPKNGFMGIFGKEELEVMYRIERPKLNSESYNPYGNPMNDSLSFENSSVDVEKVKSEILKKTGKTGQTAIAQAQIDSQFSDLTKKLEEMKQLIADNSSASQLHPNISKIQELLSQNEFSFSYIQTITEKIKKTFSLDELEDFDLLSQSVVDWIGESIQTGIPVSFKRPRVVIIVGPTGVGKTTTLVKLSAQFIKDSKDKGRNADFCFITTDTMRVGAQEQLQKYGEVVGKNVIKAQNKDDVKVIFEQYKDSMDAFFIDTAGYGPNDASNIAKLKETLSVQGLNAEIYLAFEAKTKARDLHNIMQNYEPFGYQGIIVTKCDESLQLGNVISALSERHKTLSYVTHGQKIVGTISKGNVAALLLQLEGFKIDKTHIEDKFYKEDTSEEK